MMNDRDELLEQKLAQLAAGIPVDELLGELSDDEIESLKLAASMNELHFEQDESAVAAARAKVLDAARRHLPPAGEDHLWSRLLARLKGLRQFEYRRAAIGIAGLLVVALLGSLWLNRPGAPAADSGVSLASDSPAEPAAPELTQEISQDQSGSEAMSEDRPEMIAEAVPGYQVYVPVVGHSLEEAADKAVLSQPRGLVEVATVDGDWTAVTGSTSVQAGHYVRTGRLSSATLTFYDGSQAQIGPNSELTIERLNALRPADGFRTVVLLQQKGETSHTVQFRNDAGSLYQVKTPTGSGIARGTRFQVRIDDDAQASYTVTEGKVDVSNASQTVSVLAGQQTSFAADEAPEPPEFWVSGTGFVNAIGDESWDIGNQSFILDEDVDIQGEPVVGDYVMVNGYLNDDGDPVAEIIELLWTPPEDTFKLVGEVESMGAGSWEVSGQPIQVNPETDWDPEIDVGSLVQVSGTIETPGGALVADTIELLESVEELPFEYVGIVGSNVVPWEVSGIQLALADGAEIDEDISIGDTVKVEGLIIEGVWTAYEIKLLEKDEATFEIVGELMDNIDPDWTVAGVSFEVDEFTQKEEGLELGDIVRVGGIIQDDGTWLARYIERLDATELEIVFVGTVDENDDNPWMISNLPIFVDDAEVDSGIVVGDLVRVTALIGADGRWQAKRIELIASEIPDGCVTITAVISGMSGDQIILSNGQTIILDAGIIVDGELSVNSVVALVACANGDVIDIISITVIYTPIELPPPSPGDDGDGDGNGGQETRINVCHKPGTPAEKTLSLPQPAVPAHLGHGDTEGACGN